MKCGNRPTHTLRMRLIRTSRLSLFIVALAAGFLLAPLLSGDLSATHRIVINSSHSPPYSTPQRDGYFDLLLIEAFGRLGYLVQINNLPAMRSLADAANGVADGEIGRALGLDHEFHTLKPVPEPALERREFVAFSRNVKIETKDWSALEPYHVAYVEGWQLFANNTKDARSVTALRSTDILFRFLDKDRCDIALSARLDGMTTLRKLGIKDVHVLEPPLEATPMYLYLHDDRKNLVMPLARILREMKEDGTIDFIKSQVVEKYIGI